MVVDHWHRIQCSSQERVTLAKGHVRYCTFVTSLWAVCLGPAFRPEPVRLLKVAVSHMGNIRGHVDWGPFGNAVAPNHHVLIGFSAQRHQELSTQLVIGLLQAASVNSVAL